MLISISSAVVWPLPLPRLYFFSFFCFHLVAMCSTLCNMILYGWLNDNISSHLAQIHVVASFKVSKIVMQSTIGFIHLIKHCNTMIWYEYKYVKEKSVADSKVLYISIINHQLNNFQRSLKKSRLGKQEAGCQVALQSGGKGGSLSSDSHKRRRSVTDVELWNKSYASWNQFDIHQWQHKMQ